MSSGVPDPLSAAAELDAVTISIAADDDDTLLVSADDRQPIGRSWAFDFEHNRFLMNHNQGPLDTRGFETLTGWFEKALRTDRGAHAVHPPGYGMVRPFDLIGTPVTDALSADLESRIREAILFHPLAVDVEDFTYDIDPDDELILVAFRIRLDDDTELPLAVKLP